MPLLHVHPVDSGKIAENLYAVKTGTVNFYVYTGGSSVVCFDSGFRRRQILAGLRSLGISPENVTHVFLTHSDFDHAGGLKLLKNARIYLSSAEEQMIKGKRTPRMGIFRNSRIKRDYTLLRDGDVIKAGGADVRAIETPGHTPGSMCYVADNSMLFSGDAFRLSDGRVVAIRDNINMDTETQKASIQRLARMELDINIACTGHWGTTQDFSGAISGWRSVQQQ